jgi:hypothetical protein
MHTYGVDSNERMRVWLIIGVVSVSAGWAINWGMRQLDFPLSWLIAPPTAMGCFGLLNEIFDKRLWTHTLASVLGLTKIPNLSGTWSGFVEQTSDPEPRKVEAQVIIAQSWTRISVRLRTGQSESDSQMGGIDVGHGAAVVLKYEYLNEPNPRAAPTMHSHRGFARLTYIRGDGKQTLQGEYFTGRDRRTFGILQFERRISVT